MSIKKTLIQKFINKYHLDGSVSSIKWKLKDDVLSTSFVTGDKSLLGNLTLNNFNCKELDGETIAIYTTEQLVKLLSILDDTINIKYEFPYLHVVDSQNVKVSYVLSDLSVIPDTPRLKKLPEFTTEIELTSEFRSKFIKGKNALPDTDTFTLVKDNKTGKLNVVIGHSSVATNNCTIPVDTNNSDVELLSFNANHFKAVLSANSECKNGTMKVSSDGITKLNFNIDDFSVEYYIVAVQN